MSLTIAEKMALVAQANAPNSTCYSVAKSRGIPYLTMRKYNRRAERGLPLFQHRGRPPKLDDESQTTLLTFMRENPNWDRYSLYPMVKREAKNTARRRYPLFDPPVAETSISRISVWRLTTKLIISFQNSDSRSQRLGNIVDAPVCVCM
jgi:hypothetical protein